MGIPVRREDYAYKLSKALEIKGLSPSLELDGKLQPVVIVDDISKGNEQDYAIHRWCRGHGTSGAGLQLGKLSFNNHLTSGIIVRVWRIRLHHSGLQGGLPLTHASGLYAGGKVGVTMETASTGGTQVNFTKRFTDARLDTGAVGRLPSVDIRTDNSIGLGSHMLEPYVSVEGLDIDMGGYFLLPGTRLHFEGMDGDSQYHAAVEWTETNL